MPVLYTLEYDERNPKHPALVVEGSEGKVMLSAYSVKHLYKEYKKLIELNKLLYKPT